MVLRHLLAGAGLAQAAVWVRELAMAPHRAPSSPHFKKKIFCSEEPTAPTPPPLLHQPKNNTERDPQHGRRYPSKIHWEVLLRGEHRWSA